MHVRGVSVSSCEYSCVSVSGRADTAADSDAKVDTEKDTKTDTDSKVEEAKA